MNVIPLREGHAYCIDRHGHLCTQLPESELDFIFYSLRVVKCSTPDDRLWIPYCFGPRVHGYMRDVVCKPAYPVRKDRQDT